MTARSYQYVPPENVAALLSYQYKGTDLSLVYRYVLTPMNNSLIKLFPMNIAPNTITLTSLILTVFCSTCMALWSPDFTMNLIDVSAKTINQVLNEPETDLSLYRTIRITQFLCFFSGFILFAYQTLDNLDGKQARRTKTSSPLGLLFDHGVDSINCTVSTLIMMNVFQLGTNIKMLALWGTVIVPFFFATWEEYFTDQLILPVVNGPSDGVLLSISFCLIGGYFPGFWGRSLHENFPLIHGTSIDSLVGVYQTHWLILIAGCIGVLCTIAGNITQVSKVRALIGAPSLTLMSFFLFNLCSLVWIFTSPSSIFQNHSVMFLLMNGFLFCNLVCKLMLAHLCSAHYKPFRLVLIPYLVAVAFILFCDKFKLHQLIHMTVDQVEYVTLLVLLVFNFSFWLHFVTHVVMELTEILNIYVFSTQKKTNAKVL